MTTGREVVAAARMAVDGRSSFPISATASVDGRHLSPFQTASIESRAKVRSAEGHLAAARTALKCPAGAMLPPVSGMAKALLADIDGARRQLDGTRRGLEVLARLTAPQSEVRLLVLSQDWLELRPTGRYIGSYGVLRFSLGTVRLKGYEATEVLPEPQPNVPAPPDLERWLPRWWGCRT